MAGNDSILQGAKNKIIHCVDFYNCIRSIDLRPFIKHLKLHTLVVASMVEVEGAIISYE